MPFAMLPSLIRQDQHNGRATRVRLNRSAVGMRLAMVASLGLMLGLMVSAAHAELFLGRGLVLPENPTEQRLDSWQPRVGVVVTHTGMHAARQPMLADTPAAGLKLQSAHLLGDYAMGNGFQATIGLVRGATNLPWWQTPGTSMNNSAGLSIQQMDVLSHDSLPTLLSTQADRTVPYMGAGYSGSVANARGIPTWRFQADLGIISLNASNSGHLGRVITGQQGFDELLREMRLRPVVKFSMNYKF
jgi:hypothetical protein